jgi:hypothetical protein
MNDGSRLRVGLYKTQQQQQKENTIIKLPTKVIKLRSTIRNN